MSWWCGVNCIWIKGNWFGDGTRILAFIGYIGIINFTKFINGDCDFFGILIFSIKFNFIIHGVIIHIFDINLVRIMFSGIIVVVIIILNIIVINYIVIIILGCKICNLHGICIKFIYIEATIWPRTFSGWFIHNSILVNASLKSFGVKFTLVIVGGGVGRIIMAMNNLWGMAITEIVEGKIKFGLGVMDIALFSHD